MLGQLLAQSVDAFAGVAQFGVAGLMGGLWWWERKCSRERDEQLSAAHQAILGQREHLDALLAALQNNTRAITEFTAAHEALVRAINKKSP